jgi:hypothetical protein
MEIMRGHGREKEDETSSSLPLSSLLSETMPRLVLRLKGGTAVVVVVVANWMVLLGLWLAEEVAEFGFGFEFEFGLVFGVVFAGKSSGVVLLSMLLGVIASEWLLELLVVLLLVGLVESLGLELLLVLGMSVSVSEVFSPSVGALPSFFKVLLSSGRFPRVSELVLSVGGVRVRSPSKVVVISSMFNSICTAESTPSAITSTTSSFFFISLGGISCLYGPRSPTWLRSRRKQFKISFYTEKFMMIRSQLGTAYHVHS